MVLPTVLKGIYCLWCAAARKACSFFMKLYSGADPEDFKGSTGWLMKFSQHHRIKNIQLQGEILSADVPTVSPFHKELEKVIAEEGYSCDQIYNADEMGLQWRLTPSFSLNSSGAIRAVNFKKAKDRVTLLGCVNTSGSHCLLLAFVNVSAKPKCFKRMDMSSLPVHYFLQKKLWMDCNIFSGWFQQQFLPSVRRFCSNNGLEK